MPTRWHPPCFSMNLASDRSARASGDIGGGFSLRSFGRYLHFWSLHQCFSVPSGLRSLIPASRGGAQAKGA